MRLFSPIALLLAPILFGLLWSQHRRSRRRKPTLGFSDLRLVDWSSAARPAWEGHLPLAFLAGATLLLILGLTRPQFGLGTQEIKTEGIDIMLCIDTSRSMQAFDLVPNRLEAAKEVSQVFIDSRPDDRIGLVVYAGVAFTQCPLTADHTSLKQLVGSIGFGMTRVEGTAIGTALATCVNRMKEVPGESKVVLLLTDGRNNLGEIEPLKAAELAAQFGVRVYTVGVGSAGFAATPGGDPRTRIDLDEETLHAIATKTGGRYFRATDNDSLAEVYKEIDELEKTESEPAKITTYRELYRWMVGPALLLILLALVLKATWWRESP